MTRLLCCADLHIGAGHAHRQDALADQRGMLAKIVELAVDRDVDGLLIAGDVFHRPRPTPPELHAFRTFCLLLVKADIPALAITGNAGHDLVNSDEPSALELFKSYIRVSRTPETFRFAGIDVVTLPSTPVHRLAATLGVTDRAEANTLAAEHLVNAAETLKPANGDPSVLLAHWSVTGASLPNGLPVEDLHEPILDLGALEALGFDAIVLGHIHRPQQFGPPTMSHAFYCGSPMTLDFGEAGVEHGVWILDFAAYRPEFVPLPGRDFVTIDIDLADDNWWTNQPVDDAVVRVRIKATEDHWRRYDIGALRRHLDDNYAHRCTIVPNITREERPRVEGITESLTPADAVSLWAEAQTFGQAERDVLMALLGEYMQQVQA